MSEQRYEQTADSFGRRRRRSGLLPDRLWWPLVNALQLLFTLLFSAAGISLALLLRLMTGSERIPLRMAAWIWSPVLMRGALARLEVSGQDKLDFTQPYMLVANHQSMIDICALFMAVPVPLRFMLRASLGRIPFLGTYCQAMGMVQLRRGHSSDVARQLESAAELLGQGHSLAAFPEGTRGRDGSVAAFKGGAFHAAIRAGVPLVPVAIAGSGEVMPPGGFAIRPGRIRLGFGQPIPTSDLVVADRHVLARRARAAVEALKQQLD